MMSVVDGVKSIMPERGRHDYPLLFQDVAVLNGDFLAEVPVVVEWLRAFLPGRSLPGLSQVPQWC